MSWYDDYYYKPYVSIAERRANAQKELRKLEKKGRKISPVNIEGRKIATTFWGKAWCDNLESYSDYENRLPRGRSYVRNGSVVDLQIQPGQVTAFVSGSELYEINIKIKPLAAACWDCVKRDCAGKIGSLIELLQGKLSRDVMERVTRHDAGLFPKPAEITKSCSCPDWAHMCKHVAAALYGIGARLDHQPELLFVLRKVDHLDLIAKAGDVRALVQGQSPDQKTLSDDQLSEVFGIDLEPAAPPPTAAEPKASTKTRPEKPARTKRSKHEDTKARRKQKTKSPQMKTDKRQMKS